MNVFNYLKRNARCIPKITLCISTQSVKFIVRIRTDLFVCGQIDHVILACCGNYVKPIVKVLRTNENLKNEKRNSLLDSCDFIPKACICKKQIYYRKLLI